MSTFTNNDDAKIEPNFQYAIGLDYMLTDKFAISLEAQANYLGAKSKMNDKRATLFYTSIPLLAKYYVTPWLAVQAGPQVSFLRRARHFAGNRRQIRVPSPTGPPSSQPTKVTVLKMAVLITPMGTRPVRLASPTSSVSRGPQPSAARM